jgi:hypothetical protein
MESNLFNFCLENKISSIALPKNSRPFTESGLREHLKFVELEKEILLTLPNDLESIQLIWLECTSELQKNFSQVIEHVLNLGVNWIWIPNLRFSNYPELNNGFDHKRQNEACISFQDMIQIMEKSMYSIHWSTSTYEESVKSLLLKNY